MPSAKVKKKIRYYTWAHNIEGCLQNGSFVRQWPDGKLAQFMNGDYMGDINAIPEKMTEVDAKYALDLIPKCCK